MLRQNTLRHPARRAVSRVRHAISTTTISTTSRTPTPATTTRRPSGNDPTSPSIARSTHGSTPPSLGASPARSSPAACTSSLPLTRAHPCSAGISARKTSSSSSSPPPPHCRPRRPWERSRCSGLRAHFTVPTVSGTWCGTVVSG